ncbi:unnamed protein product [Rhizoctonia solani]|uniref:Pectinesterase inhibitor domain-containing protein n=1 Tax=Rhizoctonia solani TaxID=456999 RepID=A0A8H3DC74_9AGAM|nr:unnamed protein product [Rhizoctonia solani]
MKFTRLVSLFTTVMSASVLVLAASVVTVHRGDITDLCGGRDAGEQALSLVNRLQADVRSTLASLDKCRVAGSNPTDLFNELASKVTQCNGAMAAIGVDGTDADRKTAAQVQVSDIAAKMILDIGTGCSKFQDVKIDGFDYMKLSSKIDEALKGFCVTLDGLIKGCLRLISSICMPKSLLLSAANFKGCLATFANSLMNL